MTKTRTGRQLKVIFDVGDRYGQPMFDNAVDQAEDILNAANDDQAFHPDTKVVRAVWLES